MQHKGKRNSFSSSCTAGPPHYIMKGGNDPLAHINPGCNSCSPNYEEGAHIDGCTHGACANCGRAESGQILHLPCMKELPLSFSVSTLTPRT